MCSSLKVFWLTHQWLFGVFFCFFLAGVCWRNPSESRPSWHLCRLAEPSQSSWRRSRRWSLLLKGNSWRPCGFMSTSRITKQNHRSLFDSFGRSDGVTILTVVLFASRLDSAENQVDETIFLLESYVTSTVTSWDSERSWLQNVWLIWLF